MLQKIILLSGDSQNKKGVFNMPIDRYKRAKNWFDKALRITPNNANDDIFDKFIMLWIAYNALYGELGLRDRKGTKRFVRKNYNSEYDILLNEKHSRFFKKYTVTNMQKNPQPIDTEVHQNTLKNPGKTALEKLAALMMCTYQVRCNLFHGGKSPDVPDDEEKVRNAAGFLESYLKIYFDNLPNHE